MACFTCSSSTLSPVFRSLSRAAAKYAGARMRSVRLLPTAGDWEERAAVCARCPLYTVHNKVAHCGRPFLEGVVREAAEGCGCPIGAKVRSPEEHCPVTRGYEESQPGESGCDCKWCASK